MEAEHLLEAQQTQQAQQDWRSSRPSRPSRSEGTYLEVRGGAAGIPGWRPPKALRDPLVSTLHPVPSSALGCCHLPA